MKFLSTLIAFGLFSLNTIAADPVDLEKYKLAFKDKIILDSQIYWSCTDLEGNRLLRKSKSLIQSSDEIVVDENSFTFIKNNGPKERQVTVILNSEHQAGDNWNIIRHVSILKQKLVSRNSSEYWDNIGEERVCDFATNTFGYPGNI